MDELIVPAKIDRLYEVQGFASGLMEQAGVGVRTMMKISLVIEEIFVNIACHAYAPGEGDTVIRCNVGSDHSVELEFEDSGKPYNPLDNESPDIGLQAEQREIGGLGVFLYKTIMDEIDYRLEDGKNILTLKKKEEE